MMYGNRGKLFCLFWRFFGWFLLGIITCGIGFLWIFPYMQTTWAKFYDDVKSGGAPSIARTPLTEEPLQGEPISSDA